MEMSRVYDSVKIVQDEQDFHNIAFIGNEEKNIRVLGILQK